MSTYKQLDSNDRKLLHDSLQAQGKKFDYDEQLETIHHNNQETLNNNDHRFIQTGLVNSLSFPKVTKKEYQSANLHSKELESKRLARKDETRVLDYIANKQDNTQGEYNKVRIDKSIESMVDEQFNNPFGFANCLQADNKDLFDYIKQVSIRACRAGHKSKRIQYLQHRLYDHQAGLANKALDSNFVEEEVYSRVVEDILTNPTDYCLTGYKQVITYKVIKPVYNSVEECEELTKLLIKYFPKVSNWLRKVIASSSKPGKKVKSTFYQSTPCYLSDTKFRFMQKYNKLMQVNETDLFILNQFSQYFCIESASTEVITSTLHNREGHKGYIYSLQSPVRGTIKYQTVILLEEVCYGKRYTGLVYDEQTGKYKYSKNIEQRHQEESYYKTSSTGEEYLQDYGQADLHYETIDLQEVIKSASNKVSKQFGLSDIQSVNLLQVMQDYETGITIQKVRKVITKSNNNKAQDKAQALYTATIRQLEEELKASDHVIDSYMIEVEQDKRLNWLAKQAV